MQKIKQINEEMNNKKKQFNWFDRVGFTIFLHTLKHRHTHIIHAEGGLCCCLMLITLCFENNINSNIVVVLTCIVTHYLAMLLILTKCLSMQRNVH